MKFSLTLFTLSLSVILSGHAQNNWQKGYVVTNDNDTLKGFIDQKEWDLNPKKITFTKNKERGEPKIFSAKQISYFEIENAGFYQRHVVSISKDNVGIGFSRNYYVKNVVDTVFLRILQQGKYVTLFNFKDEIKNRFYIKNGDQNAVELIYQLYQDKGIERQNEQYKTQLKFIAETSGTYAGKLGWLIKKATYDNRSLLNIVSAINGTGAEKTNNDRQKPKTKPALNLFLGGGVSMSILSYKANSTGLPWIKDQRRSRSVSNNPYVTVGVSLIPSPRVGKSIIRLDVSYNSANFNTVTTNTGISSKAEIDYTFLQNTISVTPQFIYNFYNKDNFKFFIGVGIRMNNSTYQNNVYTITSLYPSSNVTSIEDYYHLKKFWLSAPIEAGITLNKKFVICLAYNHALESIKSNGMEWYEAINSVRLGVGYNLLRK